MLCTTCPRCLITWNDEYLDRRGWRCKRCGQALRSELKTRLVELAQEIDATEGGGKPKIVEVDLERVAGDMMFQGKIMTYPGQRTRTCQRTTSR